MLGKVIGYIHGEHLCPEIAVVTGSITATPYVIEIGGRVARRNLGIEQTHIIEGFLLEGTCHIWRWNLVWRQLVPSQIKAGSCKVLPQSIGWLEVDALQHALLQVCWHRCTGLSVTGVVIEDFWDAGK